MTTTRFDEKFEMITRDSQRSFTRKKKTKRIIIIPTKLSVGVKNPTKCDKESRK